jgi:putative CRISPR-associated protein (TIGR02619 family)
MKNLECTSNLKLVKEINQMPRFIMSTCGTSLLTNRADNLEKKLLIDIANYQENDLTPENKQVIDSRIEQVEQQFQGLDIQGLKEVSAELNGILTYYQDQLAQGQQDIHCLLVTDTYQSQQIGKILQNWLRINGIKNAQIYQVQDLLTNNIDQFRLAMSALIRWAQDTLVNYRQNGYEIIFNLTGGFKSVQGFLQTIGMFYADEIVYIFQGSNELLRIPRLPIQLDVEGVINNNLAIFEKLAAGKTVTKAEANNIPETLLFVVEGEDLVSLSDWGDLIWQEYNRINH